jgi:uncharacterized protein (DUF1800 family)
VTELVAVDPASGTDIEVLYPRGRHEWRMGFSTSKTLVVAVMTQLGFRSKFVCFSLIACAAVLSLAQPVSAAGKKVQGQYVPNAGNFFLVKVNDQDLYCARKNPNNPFVPARALKQGKVQPLAAYLKQLNAQLTSLTDKKKIKRLTRTIKQTKDQSNAAKNFCAAGRPLALGTAVSGIGIEPLAITLPVQSNLQNGELTCEIISSSNNVTIDMVQGCNILVKPQDHRVGEASILYEVVRAPDGARSDPAQLLVTWDQSSDFVGDALSLVKYKDRLSLTEAIALVRWAGFGAHADELIALAQQPGGLDAVVNRLVTRDPRPECAAVEEAAIEAARPHMERRRHTITLNGTSVAFDEVKPGTQWNDVVNRTIWTSNALTHYWLYLMRHGCDPLRERIGMLWHNHFTANVGLWGGSSNSTRAHWLKSHIDILRANVPYAGSSNFTRLDRIVAMMHGADGVMLNWLNNDQNVFNVSGGNENYARELMELFTLSPKDTVTGAPNYNEQHIYAMRLALMGYSDDIADATRQVGEFRGCCDASCGNSGCIQCAALPPAEQCSTTLPLRYTDPRFYRLRWNAGNQPVGTFLFQGLPFGRYDVFKANTLGPEGHRVQPDGSLGQPIFDDPAEDNLTPYLMYSHPGVARFFASRMVATFSSLELSEDLVGPVAQSLVANQYDPTEALRIILSSSAFFAAQNRADSVSNPVERVVSFIRLLNMPMDRFVNGSQIHDLLTEIRELAWTSAYPMIVMPTVFGVQEAGKIVGNEVKDGKTFLATQQNLDFLRNFTDYLNQLDAAIDASLTPFRWQDLLPSARPSADEVLSHLSGKLGITLEVEQRALLLEYLTTISTSFQTINGQQVPLQTELYQLNWANLTNPQFAALWEQKGPGLLMLLLALPQTVLR